MKDKTGILLKKIEQKNKEIADLKQENELLKHRIFIKEKFISEQELKLYELIAITENKIVELDEAIKVSRKAKESYKNGLDAIKELNKAKKKELKQFKKSIK